jgi:hypothetical protein
MKVVVVTGSRDWSDAELLGRTLAAYHPDLIVEGGARGADTLAREWAHGAGIHCVTMPADWDRWGKSAGARRNIEMLERYPNALVIAFPLPSSKGTWHCVFEARKREHEVIVVKGREYGRLSEQEDGG